MAEIISLVKNDTVANLQVTLVRDDTGAAFNASGLTLTMQIRKKGTTGILTGGTINHDGSLSTLTSGIIVFGLGSFLLESTTVAGYYEGEIRMDLGPGTQTVFQTIDFRVREDFD